MQCSAVLCCAVLYGVVLCGEYGVVWCGAVRCCMMWCSADLLSAYHVLEPNDAILCLAHKESHKWRGGVQKNCVLTFPDVILRSDVDTMVETTFP